MKPHKPPVCKPCWELKYCPYGPLVEESPLPSAGGTITPERLAEIRQRYREMVNAFADGKFKTEDTIQEAIEVLRFLEPRKWEALAGHDASEMECNIFGHVCPVFLNAESFSETKERRRHGRYIPREVMLKVVRRDGNICQKCRRHVPDNEIHFDHIIPHSKGGPVSVENLRVLCAKCNAQKSDSLAELLDTRWKR